MGVAEELIEVSAPLTVTRRFFDEGGTPGVAEESRDESSWGGDCGGLSSSLIRTASGDWRVASGTWLAGRV